MAASVAWGSCPPANGVDGSSLPHRNRETIARVDRVDPAHGLRRVQGVHARRVVVPVHVRALHDEAQRLRRYGVRKRFGPMTDTVERTLPLRLCTVVSPSGESLKPFVRCPRRDASIDAHTCVGCMRMRSLEWDPKEGGEVCCVVGADTPALDPRADFAELAARTRMHEIGARVVMFVTSRVSLSELRALFATNDEPALAVVDLDGKLEGMVSRSALATAPAEGFVADVMERNIPGVPEDAPISLALSLFAFEKLPAAPIVKPDGVVTGICRADDLLRWVANHLGYTASKP